MDLYDQHVHSRYSFDSKADPAGNVESAIGKGLSGLTFTEHFDTHPDDWEACVYDEAAYSTTIERLRRDFGQALFIGKGIEVCYQPGRMEFILDFLQRHEFDLVILSVHYFGPRAVHRRESWVGTTAAEGTRLYLETVLDAARFCERLSTRGSRVFDVLGHLDFVKRYTHRWFDGSHVSHFNTLIDDILRTCLAADLVPEINTSTLRQNLPEPMPGAATITRYAELGGTAMSVGSDAHRSGDIGADFGHALGLLREAGLHHAAVFEKRERRLVSLDGLPAPQSDAP